MFSTAKQTPSHIPFCLPPQRDHCCPLWLYVLFGRFRTPDQWRVCPVFQRECRCRAVVTVLLDDLSAQPARITAAPAIAVPTDFPTPKYIPFVSLAGNTSCSSTGTGTPGGNFIAARGSETHVPASTTSHESPVFPIGQHCQRTSVQYPFSLYYSTVDRVYYHSHFEVERARHKFGLHHSYVFPTRLQRHQSVHSRLYLFSVSFFL